VRLRGPRIHEKVTGSTLGSALATIVVAELERRGVKLSVEEAGAIWILGAFVGGWLKRTTHA
jgi:hypothetical protein